MQFPPATAPDLAAALAPGQVRLIRAKLLFDWNRDGLFTHAYSDLSDCLTDYTLDRQLTGNLPTDVTLVQGYSAATLDLTLAGTPAFTGAIGVVPLFFKFNTASPFWTTVSGVTAPIITEGVPVTLDLIVTIPATGTIYTIRRFTGRTRICEPQRAGGIVKISCLDRAASLASLLTLPVVGIDGAAITTHHLTTATLVPASVQTQPYLNAAGAIDYALRASGVHVGPAPHPTASISMPMTGTLWPEVGVSNFAGLPMGGQSTINNEPPAWQNGKYGPAPAPTIQYFSQVPLIPTAAFDTVSLSSPGTPYSVGVGFWVYGPQPIYNESQSVYLGAYGYVTVASSTGGLGGPITFILSLAPDGLVRGELADANHNYDVIVVGNPGAPLSAGWHYVAAVMTFSGTDAVCTFFIDGTTLPARSFFFVNINQRFETGVAPWTLGGGTLTQSSTHAHFGTFSAKSVPDGVTAVNQFFSELIPVKVGCSYNADVWVWFTSAVTANYSTSISWFNADGAFLSTSVNFVSVPAATWTNVVNGFTAPAGAAFGALAPELQGTPSAAQIWYLDDAFLIANGFGPVGSVGVPTNQLCAFGILMPMQYGQIWSYQGDASFMTGVNTWPKDPPTTVTPHHLGVSLNNLTNLPNVLNTDAWGLIKDVAGAELAVVFFDEYGSFQFYNRTDLKGFFTYPLGSTASTAPQLTIDQMTDLGMTGAIDGVRNIIGWQSTSAETWFQTVWAPASYNTLDVSPFSTLVVPIADSTVQEFDTDCVFLGDFTPDLWTQFGLDKGWYAIRTDTGAALGTVRGGNSFGGVTVTISTVLGGRFATLSIQNTNAYTVRFSSLPSGGGNGSPSLRIGGYKLITDPAQSGLVAHAGSRVTYGDQTLDLGGSSWVQLPSSAQTIAQSILADTKNPIPIMQQIPIVGDPRIQLGDVFPITDPGYAGTRFVAVITAVHETFTAAQGGAGISAAGATSPAGTQHGQGLSTDLMLALISPPGAWILGDPVWGVLGTTTQLV